MRCAETLVRTLVDHFALIGGIPLLAVFDRPKTVALKWAKDGQVTEWNALFAGVALDLGLGIEVCWPSSPRQKGSIENLIGWIAAADIPILSAPDLTAAGVPPSSGDLIAALQTPALKTNEITHALIADAMSRSEICMHRVRHVLTLLGNIAGGRQRATGHSTATTRRVCCV